MGGVAYLCLSAAVALACPLLVHPTRDGIISLVAELRARVGGRARVQVDPPPLALHVGITVGIIALSTTIALTFSEIMVLFGFLGAFALCPLAFLFPAACLLRLRGRHRRPARRRPSSSPSRPPTGRRRRRARAPRGEAIAIAVWLLAVGLAHHRHHDRQLRDGLQVKSLRTHVHTLTGRCPHEFTSGSRLGSRRSPSRGRAASAAPRGR